MAAGDLLQPGCDVEVWFSVDPEGNLGLNLVLAALLICRLLFFCSFFAELIQRLQPVNLKHYSSYLTITLVRSRSLPGVVCARGSPSEIMNLP